MIRYRSVILFILLYPYWTYSRTQSITGLVVDSIDKSPIENVIIQLMDMNNTVLSYTFSAGGGSFSLPYNTNGKTLLFKHIVYRSHAVSLQDYKTPLEIFMTEEQTQLKEVTVTAPDILVKNDTLVYSVQRYADAHDRSIAEVLKKMPGIEVKENGQIKYNGEPINKFYIEGNDLLEGRYGLLTNNISHKDVQNVEIFENHQPVRVYRGIVFSEQAALNIRLTESAKFRWTGIVTGGTGFSPALYDASLFGMRIAGKRQSIDVAGINNTGRNPASQSIRHTSDNLFSSGYVQNQFQDFISVGQHAVPIDERRLRFNRSYHFSTTNSVRLTDDLDVKVNVAYERDNPEWKSSSHTDYFDESIEQLIENEYLNKVDNTANFSLRYRNPISSLFANIGYTYRNGKYALTEEQRFINNHIVMTYSPVSNNNNVYSAYGGLSKGFLSGKITVGTDFGYTRMNTAAIRNSTMIPYQSNVVSNITKIKGTVVNRIAVEGVFSAAKYGLNVKGDKDAVSSRINLKQQLNISLYPVKQIQTFIGMENYYVKFKDNVADNLLLVDAGARFVVSDKVDISISATNLMNKSHYRFSNYQTLSETVYQYRIRPRNVMVSAQIRI